MLPLVVSAQLTNYNLAFKGVADPLAVGGKRFTTSLAVTARIFTITNGTVNDCAAACDIDPNCKGFYYRINADLVSTTCNALNDIGTPTGIATATNSFSYVKQVCRLVLFLPCSHF